MGVVSQAVRCERVMTEASRYWRLVRIDATGRRRVEAIDSLQVFLSQLFPEVARGEVSDTTIQRRLLQGWRQGAKMPERDRFRQLAEGCLRCFISHQIEQTCIQLETQFGSEHGFTRCDLFSFVLDDFDSEQSTYQSLATEILQTFDPERSNLAAWTTKLVKHHPELNRFLLECGVYLISDWAILNDTTPKQLQRIFSEFHSLTPVEIQQASVLLEGYHAVYRRDRLKLRQAGRGGRCLPPTEAQLAQIAEIFRSKNNLRIPVEDVMNRLQEIAEKLRQYRIFVRGGAVKTESLDRPENHSLSMRIQSPEADNVSEENDEQGEFLKLYRDLFLDCLDRALQQVVSDRVTRLQRKQAQTAQQFLQALHLFHCQGRAMGEIASLVGLQAQYQVTRLLKLKEFRADVRQHMLALLRRYVVEKATAYVDPERLETLENQVEIALDEQISQVIQEASDEASTAKNRSCASLFARRLCRQIK